MKKQTIFIALILVALTLVTACKDDNITYAEELKAEQQLITDFIARHDIQVVTVMPTVFPWPDKVFFKSKSGLYFRLTKQGDVSTQDSLVSGDVVVARYEQYNLKVKSDTISNRTTIDSPYPSEFQYMDYTQASLGWHEAAGYMKYNKAEAQMIIYSKLGFSHQNRPATPLAFDMEIRIKKY